MINSKKKGFANVKGFTIVELVIVIAVIAILAAVLIPTFSNLVKKANLSADQQAVRQMNTALAIAGNPSDIDSAIDALAEAGYNSKKNLQPVSTGYSFYWYETAKVIVLVKDDTVVYPEGVTYEANGVLLENSVQYIDAVVNSKSDLNDAIQQGQKNIKLNANISDCEFNIPADADITIDLNGKTVDAMWTDSNQSRHQYAFNVYGKLTLKNGTINARGVMAKEGGVLVIEEGVTINAIDKDNGSAVWCSENSSVIINGGMFTAVEGKSVTNGASCVANDGGYLEINGGTFNSECGVYAISHRSGETIIKENIIVNAARAAVACQAGKLTILAGEYNAAAHESSGYALYADGGTVIVEGGTFNKTDGHDIYLKKAKVSCTIKINVEIVSEDDSVINYEMAK